MKKGIKEKLAVVYDRTAISDFVYRRSNASHVEELTRAAREREKGHRKQGMDVFWMTGHWCGHLKWQMSVIAKNLLIEEYPLAERELSRKRIQSVKDDNQGIRQTVLFTDVSEA